MHVSHNFGDGIYGLTRLFIKGDTEVLCSEVDQLKNLQPRAREIYDDHLLSRDTRFFIDAIHRLYQSDQMKRVQRFCEDGAGDLRVIQDDLYYLCMNGQTTDYIFDCSVLAR